MKSQHGNMFKKSLWDRNQSIVVKGYNSYQHLTDTKNKERDVYNMNLIVLIQILFPKNRIFYFQKTLPTFCVKRKSKCQSPVFPYLALLGTSVHLAQKFKASFLLQISFFHKTILSQSITSRFCLFKV